MNRAILLLWIIFLSGGVSHQLMSGKKKQIVALLQRNSSRNSLQRRSENMDPATLSNFVSIPLTQENSSRLMEGAVIHEPDKPDTIRLDLTTPCTPLKRQQALRCLSFFCISK